MDRFDSNLPHALYVRTGEYFTSVRPVSVSGIRAIVRVSGQASKVARKGATISVNVSQLRWVATDTRHNVISQRRATTNEINDAISNGNWGRFPV